MQQDSEGAAALAWFFEQCFREIRDSAVVGQLQRTAEVLGDGDGQKGCLDD